MCSRHRYGLALIGRTPAKCGPVWFWLGLSLASGIGHDSAGAAEATLTFVDGKQTVTNVQVLSVDEIVVDEDGSPRQLSSEQLQRLSTEQPAKTPPQQSVALRNGSLIQIESVDWQPDSSEIQIRPRRQPVVSLPVSQLAAIRFRRPSAAVDAAWLGLLASPIRSDVVVARRDDANLEPIEATIISVSRSGVTFALAGREITAPLDKIEGLLLGTTGAIEPIRSPPVTITDVYDSQWLADDIALVGTQSVPKLQIDIAGATHELAWDQIRSITFKTGIFEMVDAEVVDATYSPIGSPESFRANTLLSEWFHPRQSRALALGGGASIRYRVPSGYSKVVGSVRRDDQVRQFADTPVQVVIGDGETWQQVLTDREVLGFELPLADAKFLTLSVQRGPAEGIGDQVIWDNVRLIK
ncbi:MAG: hypothetical protein AAF539_05225 [Planctomycetota bacterium]